MVGPFGEVLVMDWGVAKVLSDADLAADQAPRDEHWSYTLLKIRSYCDSSAGWRKNG